MLLFANLPRAGGHTGRVTRFARPVRSEELLASAELQLCYPGERESRIGTCTNEGEGTGFDNGFPSAYAERWFQTPDEAAQVLRWFARELAKLGWTRASDRDTYWTFVRDDDEHVGVAVFRSSVRIDLQVDGFWPDLSSEYRPG